jgi:gluconate kinase
MSAARADSQFADLEPLHEEEAGLTVDGALPPEQILATAIEALAAAGRP